MKYLKIFESFETGYEIIDTVRGVSIEYNI
jgi:hypothetical protein